MARRRGDAAVEAAAILSAVTLMGVAGVAGFVLGRATSEGGPSVPAETENAPEEGGGAETTGDTGGETDTSTTETETGETETEETETSAAVEGDAEAGAAVFAKAGCGSCHTLEQANATGAVGPNLNETELDESEIRDTVEKGRDGMPAFEDQLEDEEIDNVAAFVAASKS